MRIGIVTQYYPPEIGAPQRRLSFLVRTLAERGHEVYVLTAMPSYPRGRIFEGYGGFWRRERHGSVTILRAPIYPTQKVSLTPRMANYLSFAASSLLVGMLFLPRLDYLLTESPPLFLGPTGRALAAMKRARWILNLSDLWPESAEVLGVVGEGWALRQARRLEMWCYRHAWMVSGQSREILEHVRCRVHGARLFHLSNGVDTETFHETRRTAEARASLAPDSCCVALYAGLHGIAQGLEQVLRAAERLRHLPSLRFVLVGDGSAKPELVAKASQLGLDNVLFLDPRPAEEIPALLASADIALVPLKVEIRGAVPSKLYEAMGARCPVVLIAGGEAAGIVRETGCGMAVEPGDEAGLANAIEALAGDADARRRFGENGRRACLERFDRRRISNSFAACLEAPDTDGVLNSPCSTPPSAE